MSLRGSLGDLGGTILLSAAFFSLFIGPVLAGIADVLLILLKLLGYIEWSWAVVIFAPLLIEVIPLAFWGVGFFLMMLAPSPSEGTNKNP